MSRPPSLSESASYSVSTDSHPLQLVNDEIPWSSSSSSSGGIPEFSTRAWPFEPLAQLRPLSQLRIALDHLHQTITAMRPDQPLQSPSDPATQGRLEASRHGTVDILARYRLIMELTERLRNRRVTQSSRRWRTIWTWMFGRTFVEAVNQRLRPFVNWVTHRIQSYFQRLDRLYDEVTTMVQVANSNQAIDAAFARFFNEARALDAARQRGMRVILRRLRARMAGLLETRARWWPRFVNAFFALSLDGAYSASSDRVGLTFLADMNVGPDRQLAERAEEEISSELLGGMNKLLR